MADDVIFTDGLSKSFKTIDVLREVNLQVKQGEIFALLGSNGAGKTTLIRILSTLLKPDSGYAKICDLDVVKQADKVREKISLTGQFTTVDSILTGRENLIMIAKLRGVSNPKQIAHDLLDKFQLNDAAERRTATYSGGMRRRLDIAMSLIGEPAVIFLDEPTTGLDPQARNEMWRTVKSLANSGTTIFLTTQYLDEAEYLADKIAILNDGVIIANGTFDELKQNFPPVKVEYVKKQPTLEEIFFSFIRKREPK